MTGCAGYQLGTTLPPGINSVYVPTFINKTDEPNIESETTNATISEFQKDGSLHIKSRPEEADAILDVVLTDYEIGPSRYDRDSPTESVEYRLYLTVNITLTRQSDGEVVVSRKGVVGNTDFNRSGSLTAAKLTALPDAAEHLAHNIVEAVVEYW
jgi:hypothetical protein